MFDLAAVFRYGDSWLLIGGLSRHLRERRIAADQKSHYPSLKFMNILQPHLISAKLSLSIVQA